MQADWLFWTAAAAVALAVVALVLAPLIRGAVCPERRASYDMQVYRDQLRQIDADLTRGVLAEAEAEAVRLEISRRLLAAADAEATEATSRGAPRGHNRLAAAAIALLLALGGGALYATLGAPGRPDLPLGPRLADLAEARANRPGQAEVEAIFAADPPRPAAAASPEDLALVERLRAILAERPDEIEGHRLLARSEASIGRWAEARAAQERLLDLLGPRAQGADHLNLAEYMIFAANGYVSPEAERQLARTLELAPENPAARYYSGLALLQGGRPDLTLQLWSRLLTEGPQDAPWIAPISLQIKDVALLAGQPAPEAPAAPPADAASEADQAAAISAMVDRLSQRLAAKGGPPEDWAQLIRSLSVLDRAEEAGAIWREARDVFAADPEALSFLRETAREAGVAE